MSVTIGCSAFIFYLIICSFAIGVQTTIVWLVTYVCSGANKKAF